MKSTSTASNSTIHFPTERLPNCSAFVYQFLKRALNAAILFLVLASNPFLELTKMRLNKSLEIIPIGIGRLTNNPSVYV